MSIKSKIKSECPLLYQLYKILTDIKDAQKIKSAENKFYSLADWQIRQLDSELYFKAQGKVLDWNHLLTYTEKMQWAKLYDKDPRKVILSDKYAVRAWVSETIGEEYLIPDVYKRQQKMRARVIAYYLPQYHPIPENDKFWGKGFTEWTNVAKAKPLFKGHYQPQIPADLGFYDLRLPEIRKAQAELAKEAGIEGFCYWHYWFGNGKKVLDMPFQEVLKSGEPDLDVYKRQF